MSVTTWPGSSCPTSRRPADRAAPFDDGGPAPSSRRGFALLLAGALAGCGSPADVVDSGSGAVSQGAGGGGGGGLACPAGTRSCDGACVDVTRDVEHCGACEVACIGPQHAAAVCAAGHCLPGACEPGFGDCDGELATGCETDLASDVHHCGACGAACARGCTAGACVTISDVSAGADFTCALLSDGAVRCWGDNTFGDLGDGSTIGRDAPTKALLDGPAQQISCGKGVDREHACAALRSGKVECWGANDSGQLAAVGPAIVSTPKIVGDLSDVIEVAAGGRHSCALTSTGELRCWGANDHGQLGLGAAPMKVNAPQLVDGAYKAVAAGAAHTCAITMDDGVACWGANDRGQLGLGMTMPQPAPVAVPQLGQVTQLALGAASSCALLADMTVRCWGAGLEGELGSGGSGDQPSPIEVGGLATVTSIAAGQDHASALIVGGAPYVWGSASWGKLGDGQSASAAYAPESIGMSMVVKMALGREHTCALLGGDTLACWGLGASGQLGNGGVTQSLKPVAVVWP